MSGRASFSPPEAARRFLFAFVAFLILCAAGSAAAGQDAPNAQEGKSPAAAQPSAKVHAVGGTGSKHFSSEQIGALSGLKVGSSVTREDLQAAADRLNQLGSFTKVAYRFTSVPGGVDIEYQVEDAPVLPVAFDNFPWLSDDELIAAIKAAIPAFDGTAPDRGKILDDIYSATALFLERKGVFVRISSAPMADPLTGKQVQQFVAAGAPEDVKAIEFSDALAANDPAIHERLPDLIGKPYSRTALELFEMEQIRPIYYSKGLVNVRFQQPIVSVVQAPDANGAKTATAVTIKVPIDPGTAYSWGSVTWKGNTAISSADLDAVVPFKAGSPADGTKIENVWAQISDIYGHRGYLDAKIDATPQFDDQTHRVNYTVTIAEGAQYRMGNLTLSGLSLDGERHIRTAWKIAPGAIFDEAFFDDFIDHGARESFGDIPYNYNKVGHFLDKHPETGKVDVMIDFQ